MRLPLRWLHDFLPLELEVTELCALLTKRGIEVKDVIYIGELLRDFIVWEVKEVNQNSIVIFDGHESRAINAISYHLAPGDKVAYHRQKQLLLTPSYLKFFDDELAYVLEPNYELGQKLTNYLDDVVLDLEILPNRADLLSILGLAREIASYREITEQVKIPDDHFRSRFRINHKDQKTFNSIKDYLSLEVIEKNACPDYIARMIGNLTILPSPLIIQWRLYASGLRPINNVVDITNYIMIKYGTPLHAFDYRKITDHKIVVRFAQKGEKITTINNEVIELTPEALVIADSKYPMAIAGIVGSAESEISYDTKEVVLECARFNPKTIRRARRALNITTEALERFELGVDPEILEQASAEASELIKYFGYGELIPGKLEERTALSPVEINLSPARVSKIIGIPFEAKLIKSILGKMCCAIEDAADGLKVRVPQARVDLRTEIDLIEEVARLYGYENLPSQFSSQIKRPGARHRHQSYINNFRQFFVGKGFYECYTISFCDQKVAKLFKKDELIKLPKPLNERYAYLRPKILATLLESVRINAARGNKNLRLFEIGKVFYYQKEFIEKNELALIICGEREPLFWSGAKATTYDFYDLKGLAEAFFDYYRIKDISYEPSNEPYLEVGLDIKFADRTLGTLGSLAKEVLDSFDINFPVLALTIDLEELINLLPGYRYYQPIPKFPSITRDFSFIITDDISPQDILEYIRELGGALLSSIEIFDYFVGKPLPPGKANLGIRLTLQSRERTLSHEEATKIFDQIINKITSRWPIQLRLPEE
ncbi:MAG: phenylalanine--tRNA ligase subunit beta [candidate division WOR-3 bacterium]